MPHQITLISRKGCHLCDDALAVLQQVASDTGAQLRVLDFDDAEPGTLPARYSEQLPVTLLDGREHDHFRVDEARLRAALSGRKRRWFL